MNTIVKTKKIFIKIKNNKLMPIYYAKKKKNKKIIIVIEEIFGVNKNIKKFCKRIAKHNYIAIAPELFSTIKNLNFNQNVNLLRIIINKISDKNIYSKLNYLIKWIKMKFKNPKIGITGFCWGGRITWLYTYYNPQKIIKCSVIWYGRLMGIKNKIHPIHPLDIGNKINIPTLGLYGKKDQSIPIDLVKKMYKKIKKNSSSKNKIIIYKHAEHGFYAEYRKSYHKKSAENAWKKMLNWFKKYI